MKEGPCLRRGVCAKTAQQPSWASVEKEKGNKYSKALREKEDKEKMKYKFKGVEVTSKVTTEWDTVTDTNLGQIDLDESKQRVISNPTMENARRIRKSGLAKEASFPPALVALELVMACREA